MTTISTQNLYDNKFMNTFYDKFMIFVGSRVMIET